MKKIKIWLAVLMAVLALPILAAANEGEHVPRDDNGNTSANGTSSAATTTTIPIYVDPTTHGMHMYIAGASGSVLVLNDPITAWDYPCVEIGTAMTSGSSLDPSATAAEYRIVNRGIGDVWFRIDGATVTQYAGTFLAPAPASGSQGGISAVSNQEYTSFEAYATATGVVCVTHGRAP